MGLKDLVPDEEDREGIFCPNCGKEGKESEIEGQYKCTTDANKCEVITWMEAK